jgi:WD40 repeat protein
MSAARAPSSPYKGLAAFEDSDLDALLFFGRERDTKVIAANLLAARFTVLYGPLGVGKSSVLHAGVIRRLRALAPDAAVLAYDSWAGDPATALVSAVAEAVEGDALSPDRPLGDALAELAGRFGSDVFLVLDQFEELFVYPHAEAVAAELADVVTRPHLRVNVLVALRDDALAELDVFTGRIPNVFGNYLGLDRLDRDAGRAAIVQPLARFNEVSGEAPVEIEPALVEAVLEEVAIGRLEWPGGARDPSAGDDAERIEAPYLQLVMERLWEAERERGSRRLQLATFEALGGAEAIVRAHLDEAMQVLEPAQRDLAARVFNQLVTPSGTKIAHEVSDLAEYAGVGEAELGPVVQSLGRERILRPVDGRFEIFHDVLAEAVLAWRSRHEAERALERQRAEADRRHRRLLILLAAAGVVLAVMAGLTVYALTQRSEAREQASLAEAEAQRARASALEAEAGALMPVSPIESDPELGLLFAAEAARLFPSQRAADTLRRALLLSHIRAILPERGVTTASFSPDGGRIVVGTDDGAVSVHPRDRASPPVTFDAGAPLTSAFFSPDGRTVLTTAEGSPARAWDLSGTQVGSFGVVVSAASYSPDGTRVLTVGQDGARIWNADDGALVAVLREPGPVHGGSFGSRGRVAVTFSGEVARVFAAETGRELAVMRQGAEITSASMTPDGDHLVTTGEDKTARLWRVRGGGQLVRELTGHSGTVTAGVVSGDGTRLITTSNDTTARLWALPAGTLITDLFGHRNRVTGAAFSEDDRSFVTWSVDGTVRVWDRGRGGARLVLAGHGDAVTSAAFHPDGETILTTSADGRARLWKARVDTTLETRARIERPITAAAFSEDGRAAAVAGGSGIEILDSTSGAELASFPAASVNALAVNGDGSVVAASQPGGTLLWRSGQGEPAALGERASALALSGDSGRVALGAPTGSTEVWSVDDGVRLARFNRPGERVTSVALSPDADRLAAGYADGTLQVWSLEEGRRLYEVLGHQEGTAVLSVAFSRDGRRLLTAGADATLRVWNAAAGGGSYALRGHSKAVEDAAFSPDGHWVVSASQRLVGLFDLPSRQRFIFLVGHPGRALAVSFDPTGRRIAAVAADGTFRSYSCEFCIGIPGLLRLAEARLAGTGRQLTPSEQRRFLGTDP